MEFMEPISGAYNPKDTEARVYKQWEESGYFNPDKLAGLAGTKPDSDTQKKYVVYMPLPNITGTLHIGHVLDNTAPDILIRHYRMKGFRTLWLPGTDHAGIATQYVVEKQLKKENTSRFELGREKFTQRVWEWKKEYGGIIYEQLKKLGISCDWSRTRFTMDEAYSKDVLGAFVRYYKKGLLYRGYRTVSWCPRCETSLSDLELEYKEETTTLYYITYGPFTLATTRPETKFGDTGLAVNPRDKRYEKYVGKKIEIESLSTEGALDAPSKKKNKISVVADEAVDVEFGTGVVKVTPAHDLTDFEIGSRHNLPLVQVIDERGRMNELAGKYAGMKTSDARAKIVEDLKATGLLQKEELYVHNVSVCYRCAHAIEPIPSKQWFLKMEPLAKTALDAVKSGSVKINPENFEKPYTAWLENIRDWTVSRQIWWGHRLPVYFCKNKQEEVSKSEVLISKQAQNSNNKIQNADNFVVSIEKPKECPFCKNCEMEQSPDVLDTWFSSALWPFAGLSEKDRKNYYPGDLVANARDILNLWDTRMIFSGIEFMGAVPFKNILVHGTVLTKDGKRMSKSLGTGIDPLKYINEYGADATRFGVIWQASGQDIRWDESAVAAGRKFLNKIWNAGRFVSQKIGDFPVSAAREPEARTEADKKIMDSLMRAKTSSARGIESFEFSKVLHELYDFFWHDFCDSYIESAKLQTESNSTAKFTVSVLSFVFLESLKLLHPFVPFVTEEIYQRLSITDKKEFLMVENIQENS